MSQSPSDPSAPRAKRFGVTPLAITVCAALGLLCVTLYAGCVADLFGGDRQAAEAMQVAVRFMQLMKAKTPQAAESLFSQDANPDEVHRELLEVDAGANFVLFEGYQSLTLSGYNVGHQQGCLLNSHTIELNAVVHYDDGSLGAFSGKLLKENGGWGLTGFNVTVPPAKQLRAN